MGRKWFLGAVTVLLVGLLGCSAGTATQENSTLVRVAFVRDHGSLWGNQLRLDMTAEEITYAHWFVDGEFMEAERLPAEASQWEELQEAVTALEPFLKEQKTEPNGSPKPQKLDGGEWFSLTLIWQRGDELREIAYEWPSCPEADALVEVVETITAQLQTP